MKNSLSKKIKIQSLVSFGIGFLIFINLLFFQENSLVITLTSCMIFALVALSSYEYIIYYLFLLLPFYMLFLINGMQLYNFIILIFLVKYFINNFSKIKIKIFILPLIFALFELIHAIGNTITSDMIKWLLTSLVFSVLLIDPYKKLKLRNVIFYFSLGMFLLSTSIIYFNGGQIIDSSSRSNLIGIAFVEKNTYSFYGCTAIMAILYLLKKDFSQNKIFILPLIVVSFSSILMISKSFFIIILICLMLFFIMTLRSIKSTLIFLFAIFGAIIIIVSNDYLSALMQSYLSRFTEADDISELTTGRWDIYKEYINYLLNHPSCLFFGKGMFSYMSIVNSIFNIPLRPHNLELEVLMAWGVVGTSLITYLIFKFYKDTRILMKPRKNKFAYLPLISFFLGLQTITLIYQNVTIIIIIYILYILLYNDFERRESYGK